MIRSKRLGAALAIGGALSLFAMGVASADTAVAGFAGKVVSVNAANNSFIAEVRAVYGASANGAAGAVLPVGKQVPILVPAGTQLVTAKGQTIALSSVQPGWLFDANVKIDTSTKTVTASKITFAATPVLNPACMKTAAGKRDDALIAGFSTYSSGITAAMTARKTGDQAAWDSGSNYKSALKTVYSQYANATKAAQKKWSSARQSAWKQFTTDAKSCGYPSDSGTSAQGTDTSL